MRAILVDIVADDQRAGEVIQRLRGLLTRSELERQPLDINEVIRDVVKLIHSEIVIKNVMMSLDLGVDLPPVPGDRVQLQQVILNLLINGIEAMSQVEDRPRELLIQSCRHGAEVALVAVRDVGIGLDPQQAERIFDSFYTTKPKGWGWACRSADRLSRCTAGGCGPYQTRDMAPRFNLRCRLLVRLTRPTACRIRACEFHTFFLSRLSGIARLAPPSLWYHGESARNFLLLS